VKLKSREKYN